MSRVLVVVPPSADHVVPTVGLGEELARRGHDVAWVGPGAMARHLPAGAQWLDTNPELSRLTPAADVGRAERGILGLKSVWEQALLPLCRSMLPGVERAVCEVGPDLLVVDQQALAGALGALRAGIPWVTSVASSADLADPLSSVPLVARWIRNELIALALASGLSPEVAERVDLRCSPLLTIAHTVPDLVGPRFAWPAPLCFAGPLLADGGWPGGVAWHRLRPGVRTVLVGPWPVDSVGERRVLGVLAAALDRSDLQVVCEAWPDAPVERPERFIPSSREARPAALDRVAAAVCRGSHDLVCESLAHGIPLVLLPVTPGESVVAEQVERAGAGVRIRSERVHPDGLAAAVRTVTDELRYRRRAAIIADSIARAGGTQAAASAIEGVLAGVGAA